MRTWAIGAAVALVASIAEAADHRDGPDVTADATADLNDLYAWTNVAKDTVYLAMSFGGTMAPLSPSDKVLYTFHLKRDTAPMSPANRGTYTDLICKFASPISAECWLGGGMTGRYVKGDPSKAAGMKDPTGDLTVHAALHADPFFFFLTGLNQMIATIQGAMGLQVYASGCPKLSGATVNALQSQLTVGAKDDFAMNNAQIIVVAVKKAAIPGVGEHFSVWASTNRSM